MRCRNSYYLFINTNNAVCVVLIYLFFIKNNKRSLRVIITTHSSDDRSVNYNGRISFN